MIIREFNLNLEETFLYSLINLIPKIPETKHSIAAKLRRDVSNMRVPSLHKVTNVNVQYRVNYIDLRILRCHIFTLIFYVLMALQNANGKRKNLIEQIYISPMVLRLKLLANTEGTNPRNFGNVVDYNNIVRFIFEYAEKGAFERDVEFR